MRVTSISIRNFRAYEESGSLRLGAINVIVGPNNTGKSSVIKALHFLQNGAGVLSRDIRTGTKEAVFQYRLSNVDQPFLGFFAPTATLSITHGHNQISHTLIAANGQEYGFGFILNQEPNNYIVPFLSGRKTAGYSEETKIQHAIAVRSDLFHLSAKIVRLSNPTYPAHETYTRACKEILGYPVYAVQSQNGQQIGIHAGLNENITIEQMGDGVANILGLLAELCVSEKKLFLLEEPENDLHPAALKALLDLIVESSKKNHGRHPLQ